MSEDPLIERWARLRFAIVGPLLAAPPAKGQLNPALRQLSQKTWKHPLTGLPTRFALSTIERWYYQARSAPTDPVAALRRPASAIDAEASMSLEDAVRETSWVALEGELQFSTIGLRTASPRSFSDSRHLPLRAFMGENE